MKRIRDTWKVATDEDNAFAAIVDGTKYKRGKREVQKLLYDKEKVKAHPELYHKIDPDKGKIYAKKLCGILKKKKWRHKSPRHRRQFCRNRASSKGKWRDLYIPCLDDHIVAHMLMQANMKAFTKGMHPYCCGSVPDRGIEFLRKTITHWIRNDRQLRYFVKLDIRKFFDNIDRNKLKALLRTKIKDKDSLWAFDQIIDAAPSACPVGFYTSPWLANLYLEKLDWYIEQNLYKIRRGKRVKYVTHNLRYVDDILLFGTSKSDLKKAVKQIKEYLKINYDLEIKPCWEIKRIGKHDKDSGKLIKGTYWLDIGGYKFCQDATILRDGIYLSAKRLARKMYKAGYYTVHQAQSIISRIGWAKHSDARRFMQECILPYVNIKEARRVISNVGKIQKQRS